ncbi:MAG: archease [Methanomassiliicoccales archaeon]
MRYELLEHTADLLVRALGSTVEECFQNAAFAMFDQMVDTSLVRTEEERSIELDCRDREECLVDLLSELLFLMDAEGMVFSAFRVEFTDRGLRCTAEGEALDLGRHDPKTEIKAVTYHMLQVDEEEPSITVLFDI